MKNKTKFRLDFPGFLFLFLFTMCFQNLYAQDAEKNRIRLGADFVKIMDAENYLEIKATARIEKRNTGVPNIPISVYYDFEDEKVLLGNTTTNMEGESRFVLKNLNDIKPDSTNTYNLGISFKGNDSFKKASKSISFKNADIKAKIIAKDSINYITATLIDVSTDSPIVGESLGVQVERLFMPLKIGEEFNHTDENGTILVNVANDIPGVDGILTIEVVLNDNDIYGTVKDLVVAPIGIPIVDESTFDQRTMWSPRNKTPLFLLILPNLIIFGIWVFIIYLSLNLFKIAKS
ncbi:MAG: hypothetical protein WBM53_15815 [Maribacter sp.]